MNDLLAQRTSADRRKEEFLATLAHELLGISTMRRRRSSHSQTAADASWFNCFAISNIWRL
jgi:hypothetical protein